MNNLFIIGEKSTHANKVGTLNIRRRFSTTRRLNLGPESPEHVRPVMDTTKILAEEAIKETIEESGRTLTREKAALLTETRDLFNITDWAHSWMQSHPHGVVLLAGGVVLISIGLPVLYFSFIKYRSTLNEVKTSDIPLIESTQSKMDSVIKGAKYDHIHPVQSPEYLDEKTDLTSLIEDLELIIQKLDDLTHQLDLMLDERDILESEYNVTLDRELTRLDEILRKFQLEYKTVMSDEAYRKILERYEIYTDYYESYERFLHSYSEYSATLNHFLDVYADLVGHTVENTMPLIDQFINRF